MAVTLLELRTRVRQAANMERSKFCSDTEIDGYINNSYKAFHNLIVTKFEDYYVADPYTFTIASGESSVALPADFLKLIAVDKSQGGRWRALKPFMYNKRNQQGYRYNRLPDVGYRVFGSDLIFAPEDDAPGDYRLIYIPRATAMSADTDSIDGVNGWEEWIVLDAAIKCLRKEESDTTDLKIERKEIREIIDFAALNRDAGEPQVIQDVNYDDDFDIIY